MDFVADTLHDGWRFRVLTIVDDWGSPQQRPDGFTTDCSTTAKCSSVTGYHTNGIEHFWSQAKQHLRRFNGIPQESFSWLLKERD